MTAIEVVRERLGELRDELSQASEKRNALVDTAVAEKRSMTEDERKNYDKLSAKRKAFKTEIATLQERETELEEAAQRAASTAETRRQTGGAKVTEAPIYRADNNHEVSYFKDLYYGTQRGDREAMERLTRNAAIEMEKRAGGDTVGTVSSPGGIPSGNAGPFAPPQWLVDQYVKLARPGRVGVDTFDKMPLLSGVSSINVPKVTGGTLTGLPSAGELTPLPEQDITTTSLSTGITTIGGKQLISLQLLEQSAIPFDQVILEDLARAYAANIDLEGLTGSGTGGHMRGLGAAAGLVTDTTSFSTQKVTGTGGLYAAIMKASATVHANRFLSPNTLLMHPTRWSWLVSAFDANNRPLVVPTAAFNPLTVNADLNSAQGAVGRIGALDVFIDPQIPTNLGAGNNQDAIYVYLRDDIKLWESTPRTEAFTATYADSAGVLYRMLGYAAMIPDRYGSSIVQISGQPLPTTFGTN